jgi:hypothetical protein
MALLMIPYNTIEFVEFTKISCVCGFIYIYKKKKIKYERTPYINLNEASPIFTYIGELFLQFKIFNRLRVLIQGIMK